MHALAEPPFHETVNSIRRRSGALADTVRFTSKSDTDALPFGLIHTSDAAAGVSGGAVDVMLGPAIKLSAVTNQQSVIASTTQKLFVQDVADESKNYVHRARITTACLLLKAKGTGSGNREIST